MGSGRCEVGVAGSAGRLRRNKGANCGLSGVGVYNQFCMSMQKENYLRIVFDRCKGLRLVWNFKDLLGRQKYFRHLFVICDTKQGPPSSLLDALYKRMKYGDLLAAIYPHDYYGVRCSEWTEKTQLNHFKPKHQLPGLARTTLDPPRARALLRRAVQEVQEFEEPVVVNFLLGSGEGGEQLVQQIQKERERGTLNYMVNLFGSQFKDFHLSFQKGLNFLRTQTSPEKLAYYYHFIVNGAALQEVRVAIECRSSDITVADRSGWRNVDFNKIERSFIGPTALYEYDQLYFYSEDHSAQVEYDLKISLFLQLFSRKAIETEKRIKISFPSEKEYFPTINVGRSTRYEIQDDIVLDENPYKDETVVKAHSSFKDEEETS